jgi:hypothetical protein
MPSWTTKLFHRCKTAAVTHCTRRRVGLRANMDLMAYNASLLPPVTEPRPSNSYASHWWKYANIRQNTKILNVNSHHYLSLHRQFIHCMKQTRSVEPWSNQRFNYITYAAVNNAGLHGSRLQHSQHCYYEQTKFLTAQSYSYVTGCGCGITYQQE